MNLYDKHENVFHIQNLKREVNHGLILKNIIKKIG